MIDLNLEKDERVVLDCEDITWVSDNNRRIRTLVLTDQGLYCVYQVKESFFSRPVDEIYRFELQDIVVEGEFAQIRQTKIKNERCLEIRFKHGMEYFSFQRQSKQVLNNWCGAICSVLGARNPADYQKERNREILTNIADQMVDGVASVLGTSSEVLFDKLEKIKERTAGTVRNQDGESRRQAGSRAVPPTGSRTSGSGTSGNRAATGSSWSLGKTGTFKNGSWSNPDVAGREEPVNRVSPGQEEPVDSVPSGRDAAADRTTESSYFVAIDGQARGPFDDRALKQFAVSGQIKRETLAWTQGMETWKPIQDIEELKELAESIPPSLK